MRRMVDDKEMITIDNRITALEQGGGGSGDAYTKAETDALLLAKLNVYKHFDDDDNPEDFYIKQPGTYSGGIELHASRDDNHHPDYANVLMTPTHIVMMANSANHGDDDDDYTGSIEITDDYVDLDVTNGTNTTTLRVTPTGVTINGSPIGGGGGSTLYRHHVQIFKADSSTYNAECVIYVDIINNSSTEITSLSAIQTILDSGVSTNFGHKGILANGIIKDGSDFRTIFEINYTLNSQTGIKELKGLYLDTTNAYALSTVINIPTDAEVSDMVFTL